MEENFFSLSLCSSTVLSTFLLSAGQAVETSWVFGLTRPGTEYTTNNQEAVRQTSMTLLSTV